MAFGDLTPSPLSMNGEEFGDLTPQPPLHEWRGGEEFDARNGGRLVSGARTLISPFGE